MQRLADRLQRRHVIPLDHLGELLGNLFLGEADAVAESIDETYLILGDFLVGHHQSHHVGKQAVPHSGVLGEDILDGLVEEIGHVRLDYCVQEAFGEDLEVGEVLDDVLNLFLSNPVIRVGHEQACRGDEHGQVLVQRAVAHFQQNVDELVHAVLQFLLTFGRGKQVDGLHADGIHGMVVAAEALPLHEVIQALAVVGE